MNKKKTELSSRSSSSNKQMTKTKTTQATTNKKNYLHSEKREAEYVDEVSGRAIQQHPIEVVINGHCHFARVM